MHNSFWVKERAVLGKSNYWDHCHYNTVSNFSFPTGLIDILILHPNPAASSVLFVNYSNIHHPLWNLILFLCFIFLSLLSFLPANHQEIVFLTQTTSTFCSFLPSPLVFQRVYALFELMSVLFRNDKLKVVTQLKLVAFICKLMVTKPGWLSKFSGKLKKKKRNLFWKITFIFAIWPSNPTSRNQLWRLVDLINYDAAILIIM